MPYIDNVVLLVLVAGLAVSGWRLRRWGARGGRLAASIFLAFYGLTLAVMLAAHCADIVYNTVLANRSAIDGSPFVYNWRTYSLLLFGVLLVREGVRVLRAAMRLGHGDAGARSEILRRVGVVLAITAPTIPIHAFFGVLISGLSVLAMLVAAVVAREPVRERTVSERHAAAAIGSPA